MKKLIFDTSVINALAADKDCDAMIEKLGGAYQMVITHTAVAEVTATPDDTKRNLILDFMERLLKFGICIYPFQWIIEGQANAYQADSKNFEWPNVNVRFRELEQEVVSRKNINLVSDKTRQSHRQLDRDYRQIFSTAKKPFEALFEGGDGNRPSLPELFHILLGEGGAYVSTGANWMERETNTHPSESEAKDFIERCPPFKALLAALCVSQYERCIREKRLESLGRPGRLDIFSSVYLVYCQVFVTNDAGQYKALKAVAQLIALEMEILKYDEFKATLFGLSAR